MRCPNCAKEIREGSAFCGYCGTPLPKASPAQPAQQPAQPAQRPAQPAQQPAQPAQQPAQPAQQPAQPPQRPAQPAQQPAQPPQRPGQPMQQPGQPMQQPGQPMQRPGQPMQRPGQPMQRPGQQAQWSAQPMQQPAPKKRTGLIVAVCILAFLLVAGGVFAFFVFRGDIDLGNIFSPTGQEDTDRDRDRDGEDDRGRDRDGDDEDDRDHDDEDDDRGKEKDKEKDEEKDKDKDKEKEDEDKNEETPRLLNSFLYADIAVCVEDQMELWPDAGEKPFADAAARLYRHTDHSLLVVTVDDAGGDIAAFTDNYVRQYRRSNTDAGSLLNEVVVITFDAARRSCYMARFTDSAHVYDLSGLTTLVASYIADGDYETAVIYLLKNATEISEYLLPNSGTEYLSEADLRELTWEECCFARNEIYARHGRIFSTPQIRAYFESKSWYDGTIAGPDFDANTGHYLNEIERANVNMILEYEKKTWGGSYY